MAGAETYANPESSSDHKTHTKLDTPFSCVADPEGVPVSIRSSLDWEEVNTLDATFLGVDVVARATRAGVAIPGGTYSGLCSSSEPIPSHAAGATDFERPHS